jgi:hypothetical protein
MFLNGNIKKNWFWLIMFNILHHFWLLIMCFDPKKKKIQKICNAHLYNLLFFDMVVVFSLK